MHATQDTKEENVTRESKDWEVLRFFIFDFVFVLCSSTIPKRNEREATSVS